MKYKEIVILRERAESALDYVNKADRDEGNRSYHLNRAAIDVNALLSFFKMLEKTAYETAEVQL